MNSESWSEAFSSAWGIFQLPSKAIQAVMPIPSGVSAKDLANAWRLVTNGRPPREAIAGFPEYHREMAAFAIRAIEERIIALPGSNQEARLLLTKDFRMSQFPKMERPTDHFTGPAFPYVFIAPISRLPENHFLRSIPFESCWQEDGHPCFILPPRPDDLVRPFYLLEVVEAATKAYRAYQLETIRRAQERERWEEEQIRIRQENDPRYQVKKAREENADLRRQLQELQQQVQSLAKEGASCGG